MGGFTQLPGIDKDPTYRSIEPEHGLEHEVVLEGENLAPKPKQTQ
jgi:hypothetical protein